VGKTDIDILK